MFIVNIVQCHFSFTSYLFVVFIVVRSVVVFIFVPRELYKLCDWEKVPELYRTF